MDEIIAVAPSSTLGSGFAVEAFNAALAAEPHFIGQDAGSTDMGPYYLGTGAPFLPRSSFKRDLELTLDAARARGIPFIMGSAVTAGTHDQLWYTVEMVTEVAKERGHRFRMAVIEGELDKELVKRRLAEGPFESVGPRGELTARHIDDCSHIVAQMGVPPFIRALEKGAEVIIAGRACDDAIFAAYPVFKGYDGGLALHMGQILESAGLAAVPTQLAGPLVGRLRKDHFLVTPNDSVRRCTTASVAEMSLYEREDPRIQRGPGGYKDLSACVFEQVEKDTVKVSGSRFVPEADYRVKLEGATLVGYRSLCIVGVRDPIMIGQIDDLIDQMRGLVRKRFDRYREDGDYFIDFHLYGKNAVMRSLEPAKDHVPLELGIVIDAIAKTQELANAVAMFARGSLQHTSYPGMVATAGNLAYPFSPFNVPVGPAYRFSVYHLMPLRDPCECFPMKLIEVG